MTTITISDSKIVFSKNKFSNIYELAKFIVNQNSDYWIYELPKAEITDDLLEKANKCRQKDNSEFINI